MVHICAGVAALDRAVFCAGIDFHAWAAIFADLREMLAGRSLTAIRIKL
jgi:hypothetical protein